MAALTNPSLLLSRGETDMLNVEYAPSEQETSAYESLEERDDVQLGMSEDLTSGYRLADGTIFLPMPAEEFLVLLENPNWLATLKAQKPKDASLVLVIEESLFTWASPVDYPERAGAIATLMKDPDIQFMILEDGPDICEVICAFARDAHKPKTKKIWAHDPPLTPFSVP
jgi:hypothetical protein